MSEVTLVPAAYRCPDHDNVEEVTARVRELVETERRIRAGTDAAAFHVSVICPGRGADPSPPTAGDTTGRGGSPNALAVTAAPSPGGAGGAGGAGVRVGTRR